MNRQKLLKTLNKISFCFFIGHILLMYGCVQESPHVDFNFIPKDCELYLRDERYVITGYQCSISTKKTDFLKKDKVTKIRICDNVDSNYINDEAVLVWVYLENESTGGKVVVDFQLALGESTKDSVSIKAYPPS